LGHGPRGYLVRHMMLLTGTRGTGAEIARPWWLALQAGQYRAKGNYTAALAAVDEGLETVKQSGEEVWSSELLRLRGDLLLDLDSSDKQQAEDHYQQAISIAELQPAKYWGLRAATSLAGLWAEAGDKQKAADMLQPKYLWFTQGFSQADLKNAKQLLEALL
jgi:predicted ATPase